jgi:hypothetical protein
MEIEQMFLKNLEIAAAILAAAAAFGPGLLGQPAQAAQGPGHAVVAVDGLVLRAAPKAGAQAIRRLGILTEVIRLNRRRQPAVIGGKPDHWVYVQANYCPDPKDTSLACETVFKKGWLADSYLAYDDSFKPMTEWREGMVEGQISDVSWSYSIATDGSYVLDWEAWSYFRKYDPCPKEQRQDGFCVEKRAETGQLQRYRDVVRAGEDGEFLYIDRRGALCHRMSALGERFCDR